MLCQVKFCLRARQIQSGLKHSASRNTFPDSLYLIYRTRYFTDSGIIGSKEFVAANYRRFKNLFNSKHEKNPKSIKGLSGVYSLKRLFKGI